jgi:hypothetical protein
MAKLNEIEKVIQQEEGFVSDNNMLNILDDAIKECNLDGFLPTSLDIPQKFSSGGNISKNTISDTDFFKLARNMFEQQGGLFEVSKGNASSQMLEGQIVGADNLNQEFHQSIPPSQGASLPGMAEPVAPIPGMPAQGTLMPGMPVQAEPMPGMIVQGEIMPGMPAQGAQMPGLPAQDASMPGIPAQGAPVSGMPAQSIDNEGIAINGNEGSEQGADPLAAINNLLNSA